MAATTTHDLPTVAGLWGGDDMQEQRAQGSPDGELIKLRKHLAGLVGNPDDSTPAADVIEKTYGVLSRAPSLVLLATLEDALEVTRRPNMPGTTHQRPNWSLALPGGLEALESSPLPRRIAKVLARPKGNRIEKP